jgi:hypothetical protein
VPPDYINASIGFTALARATGTPAKSLMRMFGPHGNPTAANLSGVISALQEKTAEHPKSGRRRPDALAMSMSALRRNIGCGRRENCGLGA